MLENFTNKNFFVTPPETVYVLDSITIVMWLELFPWANFRIHKGLVKMNALLDLCVNIPSFITITNGKVHDINILDILMIDPGSF